MHCVSNSGLVRILILFLLLCIQSFSASGQDVDSSAWWNYHLQETIIGQYHPPFNSPYQGLNSLVPVEGTATSVTTTAFLGTELWKNAELYGNAELTAGGGLSQTLGMADALNGETYRIGSPAPLVYIARLYFSQYFALDDSKMKVDDDLNQLAGNKPEHYIHLLVGKFQLEDFYDGNDYAHDPRTQFMNWGLMSNGAWDYPANTRGYTSGIMLEYAQKGFSVRISSVLEPEFANEMPVDFDIAKAHGETLEFQKDYSLKKRKGSIKLLGFYNQAHMGSYSDAIQQYEENKVKPGDTLDITSTRAYGHNKYGFGINIQQELTDNIGLFFRSSWNDGQNETWAYTEVDQTASAGLNFSGKAWKRPDDNWGVAYVISGISKIHEEYLADGGYGFIIGDGRAGTMEYAPEMVLETYYSFNFLKKGFYLSPDYQFVGNPAYNRARGPVNVFALRAHYEF